MLKKVTVIVPVFNAEKNLGTCIESALNQDYKDFQLILVDDGSTDRSAEICKSYSDPRVIYIGKQNGGVSSARNEGMKYLSGGGYFTFLDADDYLPNNAISTLVNALESAEADIAVGTFEYVYTDKTQPHAGRLVKGVYDIQQLLPSFIDDGTLSGFLIGSVCATLYKNDIVIENQIAFDTEVRNNEDGLFNFEYAIHAQKVAVVDDCVYCYRQHNQGGSSKRVQEVDFNSKIIHRLETLPWDKEKNHFTKQVKARNVSLALWDILLYPKAMGFSEGINYISKRIHSDEVREGLKYIKYNKLTTYKKVFAYLIKFKLSITLYLIVRHVYPYLSSRLRR